MVSVQLSTPRLFEFVAFFGQRICIFLDNDMRFFGKPFVGFVLSDSIEASKG
jgi:hypothetical protein